MYAERRKQGESPTGFSQALKRRSSAFHYRTSSFCFILIFLHMNPPNLLQKINKISTGPEKLLITLLSRFKERLLFRRENLVSHHKGTCRFNRPWFPSLNGISASKNYSQRICYFDDHPIFPHLNLPIRIRPKRHMAICSFYDPRPSPNFPKKVQETHEPNC